MSAEATTDELDRLLVAIWQVLHEGRGASARFVEGLIAELRDEASAPDRRLASVGRDWWSFLARGRSIHDVALSLGTPEERRDANSAFARKVERVSRLLEPYHPAFGRPSVSSSLTGVSSTSAEALSLAIRSGDLFVALCNEDEIRIVCRKSADAAFFLNERGYEFRPLPDEYAAVFEVEGHYFVLSVRDDRAKAVELMKLRDRGIPFSIGREWNPCEVFEHLRERGLADGGYWSVGNFWPHGFEVRWNE